MNPLRVFFVANFKFNDRGSEYGFKRVDFDAFYTDLNDALHHVFNGFCGEAGWYQGMIIEEKEEGNPFFHEGIRRWFLWNEDQHVMEEVPEPKWFKDVVNIVG